MNSKKALKSMCKHCELMSIRKNVFIGCPFRSISSDYCDEFEIIKKDLEELEKMRGEKNAKTKSR